MQVSVLMTCYNERAFVGDAIASVMRQTALDRVLEVILVDDASRDGSRELLEKLAAQYPRLQVVHNPTNIGLPASRNIALKLAQAPLVAFLDGDDLWIETKLEHQLSVLAQCPKHSLLYSDFHDFTLPDLSDAQPIRVRRFHADMPDTLRRVYLDDGPIVPSTVLIRRDLLLTVGGFDEALRLGDDTDLYLRLAGAGCRFQHMDTPLVYKRRHAGNITRRLSLLVDAYKQATEHYADAFPALRPWRRHRLARRFAKVGHDCAGHGATRQALHYLALALRHDPCYGRIYLYLVLALAPARWREMALKTFRRYRYGAPPASLAPWPGARG